MGGNGNSGNARDAAPAQRRPSSATGGGGGGGAARGGAARGRRASESDVAEARGGAARRVTAWAAGKDVYAMLGTLREFAYLELRDDVPLRRGASQAALKKAFHRASLSLHPDRIQHSNLSASRKAEAEELFKALSAAYDQATGDNPLEA